MSSSSRGSGPSSSGPRAVSGVSGAGSGSTSGGSGSRSRGFSSSSSASASAWSQAFSQDELDDEEDEAALKGGEMKTRDAVIFLIDCQPSMMEPDADGMVPFQKTIQCVVTMLKTKIISDPQDLVGCVLYNARATSNPSNFAHIFVYIDLGELSAKRIKEFEQLGEPSFFDKHIGSCDNSEGGGSEWFQSLWVTSMMYSSLGVKNTFQRVFLITNDDNPNEGPHYDDLKRKAIQKAEDLEELDVQVVLFALRKGGIFKHERFFKDVLLVDPAEEDHKSMEKSYSSLDEMLDGFRKKNYKKRSLGSIQLELGPAVSIAVKIYCLFREAKKEPAGWLDAKTNDPLECVTQYICKDTGNMLEDWQMKSFYAYGGQKVFFSKDEMKQIKSFGSPGLKLMGFKPIDTLKPYHNIKNPYFLYPDEASTKGSTVAFAALIMEMHGMGKYAVARLTYRKYSVPRFVALLPQLEKFDSEGAIINPPGLHVVFLPYADDIRHLKLEPQPIASPDLIFKAKQIVQSLRVRITDHPYSNPALQRHYAVLQALALDEDLPEDLVDTLEPDEEGIGKFRGIIEDFQCAVWDAPPDSDDERYAGKKRKKPTGENNAKRQKAAEEGDVKDFDWVTLASNDQLGKLTIPQLKIYCRHHKLGLSGKKADLIDRIMAHLESADR